MLFCDIIVAIVRRWKKTNGASWQIGFKWQVEVSGPVLAGNKLADISSSPHSNSSRMWYANMHARAGHLSHISSRRKPVVSFHRTTLLCTEHSSTRTLVIDLQFSLMIEQNSAELRLAPCTSPTPRSANLHLWMLFGCILELAVQFIVDRAVNKFLPSISTIISAVFCAVGLYASNTACALKASESGFTLQGCVVVAESSRDFSAHTAMSSSSLFDERWHVSRERAKEERLYCNE